MPFPNPRNKYRNIKVLVNGVKIDSKKEGRKYQELLLLEKCGKITDLELQPVFPVFINDKKIFTYKADFRYKENDKIHILDVKGYKKGPAWAMFRIKQKAVEAYYSIIIEVC